MWLRPSGRNMRRRQLRRRRRRRPLLHLPPPLRHTLSELPHSLPFFLLPRHNYSLSSPSNSVVGLLLLLLHFRRRRLPSRRRLCRRPSSKQWQWLPLLSLGRSGHLGWAEDLGGANASQPPIRLKEFLPQGAATNAKVCGGVGQKNKRTLFRLALQKKWREEPEGGACTQYLTLPART